MYLISKTLKHFGEDWGELDMASLCGLIHFCFISFSRLWSSLLLHAPRLSILSRITWIRLLFVIYFVTFVFVEPFLWTAGLQNLTYPEIHLFIQLFPFIDYFKSYFWRLPVIPRLALNFLKVSLHHWAARLSCQLVSSFLFVRLIKKKKSPINITLTLK